MGGFVEVVPSDSGAIQAAAALGAGPDLTSSVSYLREALAGPLPGFDAWKTMMPPFRGKEGAELAEGREGEKEASVLVLLHPTSGGLAFPLLERGKKLRHHAGQISLPGGALEGNEAPLDAALRETEEEIGVRVPTTAVLGSLSDISALPSGYRVHPFVAFMSELPPYRLQRDEVVGFFEMPLGILLDPRNASSLSIYWAERDWTVPCYSYNGKIVWGLTAMILAELGAVLRSMRKDGEISAARDLGPLQGAARPEASGRAAR